MLARSSRDLRADQDGAILITAVMMGAVLVAAILYLLQVGEAIFVRERLQDAADATAFEAAVWHARGMNATAVLNILMSAALAVIATIRQIELVCLVIPGAQSCASAAFQWEQRLDDPVETSLSVLQHLQALVAVQTPVFASVVASGVASGFEDRSDPSMRGTTFSLALMPMVVDRLFDEVPGVAGVIPSRLPVEVLGDAAVIFPSLPVQKGAFPDLCEKAATFLLHQINTLIERFTERIDGLDVVVNFMNNWLTSRIAESLIGWVASNFSGLMCRPTQALLDQAIEDIAGQNCSGQEDEREEEQQEARDWNDAHPDEPPRDVPADWSTTEQEDCMDVETENAEDNQRVLDIEQVPAVVYGLAKNGNPFLHVWSTVEEDLPDAEQDEDDPEPRKAVAEAEYYFDCEGTWEDCSDDALWRPGWTARMRRYRKPYEELDMGGFVYGRIMGALRAQAGDFIGAHLESAIEDALSGATCHAASGAAASVCESVSGAVIDPLTDWIKQKAAQFVGDRFRTGQSSVNNTVGSGLQGGAEWGINELIDDGLERVTGFAADHGVEVPNTLGYHHDRRIH